MDLNLFDFSGRSTVGGQRRSAKDRPPKKDMYLGRFQERPLSNTPMRPAGPIRRTCGVIKLPVMYYPLRPPPSAAQLVTTADPQVVLGSVVQQLWVKRLSSLQPVDSVSGEPINPDAMPQENNTISATTAAAATGSAAVTSEQSSLSVQLSNMSQASATTKLPMGINSVKSPIINAQYNNVQNTNLRMATSQQPPSLPNHYSANNIHVDNNTTPTAACVIKPHNNPTATTNNNAVHPLGPSPQSVVAAGAVATGTSPQSFIPIQQNGQGLLLQPNNVVYMQLPQGTAKGGGTNFISSTAKATAALQMVQQLPQTVPQQGLNHSFITETEIRLQEQKVKLLRQQLGLTS